MSASGINSRLARHGSAPHRHYQLQQYGVKKRKHEDFDAEQAAMVLARVQADLVAEPLGSADTGAPTCSPVAGGCQTEQHAMNTCTP